MTLRTITFDDSIYKLVPLEPTDEMRFQTTHVRNDIEYETILEMLRVAIAAAPEYQDIAQSVLKENGKLRQRLANKNALIKLLKANQDTKKDE